MQSAQRQQPAQPAAPAQRPAEHSPSATTPSPGAGREQCSRVGERAGDDRAALPLAAELARCVARRATLSRYAIKKYSGAKWRQADDLTVATKMGYPNHVLYARKGMAATATKKLRKVGSSIELVERAGKKTFTSGTKSKELRKVEARNTDNGTEGDAMLLYADCGRSSGVVVGSQDRRAVYKRAGKSRTTATTSDPTAKTRAASAAIIRRLRSRRSASTPAARLKRTTGRNCANETRPALAGECVSASVSSGYAIDAMAVPTAESSCPVWNSMKSRFRRSGTSSVTPPSSQAPGPAPVA